jgi:hypothetical protein
LEPVAATISFEVGRRFRWSTSAKPTVPPATPLVIWASLYVLAGVAGATCEGNCP